MESLRNIKGQLAQLKAQLPPPRGKDPVVVLAAKGPRPENDPADNGFLHWYYSDLGELEELKAKFDREYGPETRSPHDAPCIFVHLTEASEIREEQFQGRHLEHGEVAS